MRDGDIVAHSLQAPVPPDLALTLVFLSEGEKPVQEADNKRQQIQRQQGDSHAHYGHGQTERQICHWLPPGVINAVTNKTFRAQTAQIIAQKTGIHSIAILSSHSLHTSVLF